MRKLEVECPDCSQTVIPQWNPFEGCWSCPDCYSDDLDDVVREAEGDYSGPLTADFEHTNRNPMM
jgi:hypothetical protein